MMIDLWRRFQREANANRGKAGLLAALFVFGCCFWVPLLARTLAPKRVAAATVASAVPVIAPSSTNQLTVGATDIDAGKFWDSLAKSLADDSMFHSAEVQTFERNPFHVAESSEPLPVLFADEPKPPKIELKATVAVEDDAKPLQLSSTIIGKTRRGAMINGQLYLQGRRLQANGQSYLLTSIESHRVILSSGAQTIELTLDRPKLNDVLTRGEPIEAPVQ